MLLFKCNRHAKTINSRKSIQKLLSIDNQNRNQGQFLYNLSWQYIIVECRFLFILLYICVIVLVVLLNNNHQINSVNCYLI